MHPQPRDSCCILRLRVEFRRRRQPVVDRSDDESLANEHRRQAGDLGLVATRPAAAVNPDQDGRVCRVGRRVDVEARQLRWCALVLRVGQVQDGFHRHAASLQRGGILRLAALPLRPPA